MRYRARHLRSNRHLCSHNAFRAGAVFVLICGVMHTGCVVPGMIRPCPWTFIEQQRELMKIVPIGCSRDDALSRLQKAGIDGTFGVSESVYYCDIWTRENGERWHLNVALYFDEEGTLYEVRHAQADTSVFTDTDTDPFLQRQDGALNQNAVMPQGNQSSGNRAEAPAGTPSAETRLDPRGAATLPSDDQAGSSIRTGRDGLREPYRRDQF